MSAAEKKSPIDLYIDSLPRSKSFLDYEKAKVWFYDNFPEATCSEYDRFVYRVAERVGV